VSPGALDLDGAPRVVLAEQIHQSGEPAQPLGAAFRAQCRGIPHERDETIVGRALRRGRP